ncbi:hypothetical protein FACS1894211_01310 [Clostridia bacterium]|nr:hypothetical protein FACS1894211_01310 [Clostridia bacterium]
MKVTKILGLILSVLFAAAGLGLGLTLALTGSPAYPYFAVISTGIVGLASVIGVIVHKAGKNPLFKPEKRFGSALKLPGFLLSAMGGICGLISVLIETGNAAWAFAMIGVVLWAVQIVILSVKTASVSFSIFWSCVGMVSGMLVIGPVILLIIGLKVAKGMAKEIVHQAGNIFSGRGVQDPVHGTVTDNYGNVYNIDPSSNRFTAKDGHTYQVEGSNIVLIR